MNRLTLLFIVTTLMGAATSVFLSIALIQEARDRSAAVEAVYKIGLDDGEQFTRDQIKRDAAIADLIEEANAHIAEEKL
jgi:hypothetical protein